MTVIMDTGIATKCIYGNHKKFEGDRTGAISFPIYQTATYAHPAVGQSTGYDYSRLQNPTREQLEKIVASLEGGLDALAFSSGMAAITTLMEIFKPATISFRKQICMAEVSVYLIILIRKMVLSSAGSILQRKIRKTTSKKIQKQSISRHRLIQ